MDYQQMIDHPSKQGRRTWAIAHRVRPDGVMQFWNCYAAAWFVDNTLSPFFGPQEQHGDYLVEWIDTWAEPEEDISE